MEKERLNLQTCWSGKLEKKRFEVIWDSIIIYFEMEPNQEVEVNQRHWKILNVDNQSFYILCFHCSKCQYFRHHYLNLNLSNTVTIFKTIAIIMIADVSIRTMAITWHSLFHVPWQMSPPPPPSPLHQTGDDGDDVDYDDDDDYHLAFPEPLNSSLVLAGASRPGQWHKEALQKWTLNFLKISS